MKIFLDERSISFQKDAPSSPLAQELVVNFQNAEKLLSEWVEFQRYEKFRSLYVINPDGGEESGEAFKVFQSFFKLVPAAGGVVRNEKGELLFIHRYGHWDLPKGKIGKKDYRGATSYENEAARFAAVREVMEETGLQTVTITAELPSTWHIYKEKEKWILKQTRWFSMESDSAQPLVPETKEGIFLVKWTSPNAIHCVMAHTYASIRELLLEIVF